MSAFLTALKADAEANTGQGVKAASDSRNEMFRINPYKLSVMPGWNSRDMKAAENVEHIGMLARSIADCGVQEPLTVFTEDGHIYVSDGHCRLAAVKWAMEKMGVELKSIPVKTEDRGASMSDRLASQLVRNSGKGLTDLEKAQVFLRLRRLGWDDAAIASRAGMTGAAAVARIVELNELPDEMKQHINDGTLSTSLAIDAVKKAAGDGKAAAAKITKVKADKTAKVAAKPIKAGKAKSKAAGANVLAGPPKAVRVTAKDMGEKGATQRNKVAALVCNVLDNDVTYVMSSGRVSASFSLADWTKICNAVGHKSEV